MRAYTREQALEIAQRNAINAISSGYTAVQDTDDPAAWTVTKPNGETYRVHLHFNPSDRTEYCVFCSCKFSGDGFTNWTCKHGEICREIADAAYYREVDQSIRDTFHRLTEEEEREEQEAFEQWVIEQETLMEYADWSGERGIYLPTFQGDPRIFKMFA